MHKDSPWELSLAIPALMLTRKISLGFLIRMIEDVYNIKVTLRTSRAKALAELARAETERAGLEREYQRSLKRFAQRPGVEPESVELDVDGEP